MAGHTSAPEDVVGPVVVKSGAVTRLGSCEEAVRDEEVCAMEVDLGVKEERERVSDTGAEKCPVVERTSPVTVALSVSSSTVASTSEEPVLDPTVVPSDMDCDVDISHRNRRRGRPSRRTSGGGKGAGTEAEGSPLDHGIDTVDTLDMDERERQVEVAEAEDEEERISFQCPYHFCDTCHHFYGKRGGGPAFLYKCLNCPRAFHINCIPPGSRYNSLCLLCPKHPQSFLPPTEPLPVAADGSSSFDSSKIIAYFAELPLPSEKDVTEKLMISANTLNPYHFRLSTSILKVSVLAWGGQY